MSLLSSRDLRLLLGLVVVLAGCGITRASTPCTSIVFVPCACLYPDADGRLALIDISQYFAYPTTPKSDNADKYSYKFNCENFACPNIPHPQAVACQYIKSQEFEVGLGVVNSNTTWEITDLSDEHFQFIVTYYDGDGGRVTQVKFTYADSDMAMKVVSEGNNQFNMEVTGNLVKKVSSFSLNKELKKY